MSHAAIAATTAVCAGLDKSQRVQWVYVFSWSEKEELKVAVKSKLLEYQNEPLDLRAYVTWVVGAVDKGWRRKAFHDFDYLTVEPSGGTLLLIGFGSLLVSIGTYFFATKNGIMCE